ncbi:uncharacterized protein LOC131242736 [Magnolia sinica]|uniref:uncharacterized protein LOC131242736 n=1 Tax=Magnolia sinica TaxID=86752 RepID=UPI002658302A|nr:uncharacterized protein LOC131242736 [Magnolia sinica]XP_058097553.1 uncharacterized protein LOC131242736 [Magnolia sinica]
MASQTRGNEPISNEGGATVHRNEISDPVDANRNLNGEIGGEASGGLQVVVPVPGNPEIENRAQAFGERLVEIPHPVPDIENAMPAADQARNRPSTSTVLLFAGGSIVLISGALLFIAIFNFPSSHEFFAVFCIFCIGLIIIYLGVVCG